MLLARLTDQGSGFCVACECGMIGQIYTGASTVIVNGLPVSQLNSIVQGACGHVGFLVGITKNIANGMPMGTMGSAFQGVFTGTINTCSTNVGSN